jgi:hypothetical protein
MKSFGIPRKDLYGSPEPTVAKEGDYDNETVYPEIRVSGGQAKLFGPEGLKAGDRLKLDGELEVKSVVTTDRDGEKHHELVLCLVKGDTEKADRDDDDDEESDEEGGTREPNPGLDYLIRRAGEG